MTMNFDYQKAATMNNILTRLESLEQSRAAQANEIETLRKLIAMQDTAIESINETVKALKRGMESHDKTILNLALSQDNDRASVIRGHIDHTQKLTDLREAIATQLETMHKRIDAQRNAPGWIHYVDADDLQKIIDKRVIEQLKRFASLFFVGEPSERRKNVSIQDGQGNEKSAPSFGIADYPQR